MSLIHLPTFLAVLLFYLVGCLTGFLAGFFFGARHEHRRRRRHQEYVLSQIDAEDDLMQGVTKLAGEDDDDF